MTEIDLTDTAERRPVPAVPPYFLTAALAGAIWLFAASLDGPWHLMVLQVAVTFAVFSVIAAGFDGLRALHRQRIAATTARVVAGEEGIAIVADAAGAIRSLNPAAATCITDGVAGTVNHILRDHVANPEGERLTLQARAEFEGEAERPLGPGAGRLRVRDLTQGLYLWRLEDPANDGPEAAMDASDGTARSAPPDPGWQRVEDLPVPLLRLRPTGEIIAATREARSILQIPTGEAVKIQDLLDGLGRPISEWLRGAAKGGERRQPEFLRVTAGRGETFVQVSLVPVPHGQGDAAELVAILSDATEFKSLEAQFVQSQKMQAIGQLAGGIAHDFNNLLTAISGHCDLLLLRHDTSDEDYGDLIQIHQNTNRAASLVRQLLAYSRKQNLRFEVLDVRDTLADLTHLLNRLVGERVSLLLEHAPEGAKVRADRRQLEQVLMNLVVNSRDAMPDGGEILIETGRALFDEGFERDRAHVPAGDYVVIRVTDEGAGITPDKLSKIFEPFFTTKRTGEGTGLGLSTVYGIVKQTGGFIFADSAVGEGTTFTIYLPAFEEGAETETRRNDLSSLPSATGPTEEGVVLLVEDEAPVRAFASRALRLRGYTVIEADSAETALDLLADENVSIDLFVTDVIMPGLDGPSWVKRALVARPGTPVVFVSGYAEDAFGDGEGEIPKSVFLPKPFSLNDLTAVVEAQMEHRVTAAD